MGDSPGFAESKERLRADLRDLMKLQTEIIKMKICEMSKRRETTLFYFLNGLTELCSITNLCLMLWEITLCPCIITIKRELCSKSTKCVQIMPQIYKLDRLL